MKKTEKEWRQELSLEVFHVTREAGTEPPFSGKYNKFYEDGIYECVCCGTQLFDGSDKYDSGCGWPSYSAAIDNGVIKEVNDTSHGMVRTEVRCAKCDAHLGHLFPDGPQPSGQRYCINSLSLDFKASDS